MTRKLTDKQIISEAMYSARESLKANVPQPPTNADGSFKSLRQLGSERENREGEAREAAREKIRLSDEVTMSDPEQLQWEREQRQTSRPRDEYETVIPDGVKFVFYVLLFIACIAGLIINS